MSKLRVFYKLDGVDRYEDIDPAFIPLNYGSIHVDYHRMNERANLYKDCLINNGAREVEIRWTK